MYRREKIAKLYKNMFRSSRSAPGFQTLTTQVFDDRDQYLDNDSVFATRPELVVRFLPREGDAQARWTLEYDFVLGLGPDGSRPLT